jgi:hypothetical protein
VRKAVNGKGKPETVRKLGQIKELLIPKGLYIVDYAFDGDSCYHRLHKEFKNIWRCKSRQLPDPRRLFDMPILPQLVRSDPFHILKKVRHRLLCFDADADPEKDSQGFFSFSHVRTYVELQPIVYQNTKAIKMHDSLPLHLFLSEQYSPFCRRFFCRILRVFPLVLDDFGSDRYRASHIRCSTARHERGCAACLRREQGKAILRRLVAVKTRSTIHSPFPVPFPPFREK